MSDSFPLRTDNPPEWAKMRVRELWAAEGKINPNGDWFRAFARYIAEHEKPPVDPLLIEARELAADSAAKLQHPSVSDIRAGRKDDDLSYGVGLALAALHRGIELGRSQSKGVRHVD